MRLRASARRFPVVRSTGTAELVVDALAAYRVTRLLISDGVFDRPRVATHSFLERRGRTKLLELSECPWCLGMWVAGGVVVLRRAVPALWSPLAATLAFSASSGLLASFVREADDGHRIAEQVIEQVTEGDGTDAALVHQLPQR